MANAGVTVRVVEPIRVLSVRRRLAGQEEIVEAIRELRPRIGVDLAGPPMALRLGFPRDGKNDYELAFPVKKAVERDGFVAKTLLSLPMFSITHTGPIEGGPEGTNLIDSRKDLVGFVNERMALAGDDPERFLYHEGIDGDGDLSARFVIENQYPYHMPIWLDALEGGTKRVAGAEAARRVMAGSEGMADSLDGRRAAAWVPGAIERLDREVTDERDRACILNACAHHYIVQSGMLLEAAFEEVGHDLRKLVQKMTDEPFLGGKYWLDETGPQALLYIQRRPARMEAYEKATDPAEKRYEACFCPLVRDAICEGRHVSRTFCHCSGGWYAQEWETVFGVKLEVRLVQTMLEGADACVFAVVIPDGWL